MKSFEYVHILNIEEQQDYISFFRQKHNDGLAKVRRFIKDNSTKLIEEYNIFEKELVHQYKEDLDSYYAKIDLWHAKKCYCGSDLVFKNDYGFWGCPNYWSKTNKHVTFKHNQSEVFSQNLKHIKVRLSHNWSTEILKRCKLNKQITAKELILFYESQGLEDLRAKYGFKHSLKSISSFILANEHSKREEKEIKDFLNPFFEKSNYQMYIKFKKISGKEEIRILDLVVSDEKNVFLIEIKRHNIYIDSEQLCLYRDLLQYIMTQKNDKRILVPLFIVNEYYRQSINNSSCINFNELKEISSKAAIKEMFIKNAFS